MKKPIKIFWNIPSKRSYTLLHIVFRGNEEPLHRFQYQIISGKIFSRNGFFKVFKNKFWYPLLNTDLTHLLFEVALMYFYQASNCESPVTLLPYPVLHKAEWRLPSPLHLKHLNKQFIRRWPLFGQLKHKRFFFSNSICFPM